MSLQRKVVWLILLAFLVYGVLTTAAQRLFILPSFYTLEEEEAKEDMDRAVEAIDNEIQSLDASASDWAFWDDTYQYVQNQNEEYLADNLNELSLDALKVNLLYLFDTQQQLVWGMFYDLENQEVILMPELSGALSEIQFSDTESSSGGVVKTSMGPVMVAARPILTSDRQGPVMGTFILGRLLNTTEIAARARINLSATTIMAGELNAETTAIVADLDMPGETLIQQEKTISHVYRVFSDVAEEPALLLHVDVPRTISARGERSVMFALVSLSGAGFVILLVLIISLRRMVLIPLKKLTEHTVNVGKNNDRYTPLGLNRSDEIGVLGQEFDQMVDRLTEARKSLIEQSYLSGMAEVAAGVLHNVGNVLNSVNVSCTLILEQLRQSRVENVAKVANLVANPEGGLGHFLTEDPRGQQIPGYLASLASALQDEQQLLIKESTSLQRQIDHIKGIVSMQQTYSGVSRISENIPPEQLVEDAIRINEESLTSSKITVVRDYLQVPPVIVDKHKALQVLLNLIKNAQLACDESGKDEKVITVRIFSLEEGQVQIQVSDNGVGIPPETITRIFQYGFSTRKTGHGIGLHVSALAARELGGSLVAHSEGTQMGATFTLELPCQQEAKDALQ